MNAAEAFAVWFATNYPAEEPSPQDAFEAGWAVRGGGLAHPDLPDDDWNFGPFAPDDLKRWAETYGHPEHWAARAKALHAQLEAQRRITEFDVAVPMSELRKDGEALARGLDSFFNDLRYTAPELWGERISRLGLQVTAAMATFGYPKKAEAA